MRLKATGDKKGKSKRKRKGETGLKGEEELSRMERWNSKEERQE